VALPPFQSLLDGHGRAVHRFLVARVGPVDADDCYQETWVAVLRAYPDLQSDANLRGWLMTIAHRKAIDHVRARARRPVPDADAGTTTAVLDPASSTLDPLWSQVARLPDKQRTAVALRYLGDLSHAEIAETMGISEAAARRNVYEGLQRLRKEHADDRVA
jgi:RNA polymerase sigma factor (sigma-70 family)